MACINDIITPKGVKINFNSGSNYTDCSVYTGLTSTNITGVTYCTNMGGDDVCDLTGITATLMEIYVKIVCEGCCEQIFRVNLDDCCDNIEVSPTPTITPSMTATPGASVSVTPTQTPEPTPSNTPTQTPEPTPSNTPTPEPTPSNTVTPSMTATPGASVSVTPTMTPTPSLAPCYELVSVNVISGGDITYTDCCGVIQVETVTTGEYLVPACVQTNSISAVTAVIDTNIDYTTGIPCVCPTPTPSVTPTSTPTTTPTLPLNSVSVTPTNTPTLTPTPSPNLSTPTPTPTNTITPTPTPTPACECNTYLIEFSENCGEAITWTDCDTGLIKSEQGLYFGLEGTSFTGGTSITLCSCSIPTVGCPGVVITLSSVGCEAYRYYEVKEVNDCATGSDFGEIYIVRSSSILLVGEFINTTIVPSPPTCAWKVISEVAGPLYDGVVTNSCGTGTPVSCCC